MTQKQNLETLLAKVEAGITGAWDFEAVHAGGFASDAYHGSLDAALSLHKAVLGGGWIYTLWGNDVEASVSVSTATLRRRAQHNAKSKENPARSWLIAIIKALIAECDATNHKDYATDGEIHGTEETQ